MELDELKEAFVAVIQLKTQAPGVLHQVTLRPDKVYDGMIRVGDTPGDEAVGWQYPENIQIVRVLGRAVENVALPDHDPKQIGRAHV